MDYFSILNLNKEPFSNSPDPDYFFHSQQHVSCLQKLELSLRLRRGLNVVIGEVGTGKTTLCRQLIRKFSSDDDVETHLILDSYFGTPHEFLLTVAGMLTGETLPDSADDFKLKELIKQVLFRKGVDQGMTVVLIIDEGQKLPVFCLELLREFLNFETNEHKLLQIAIFAQKEFQNTLQEHANFADRINLLHLLEPMNFQDTRSMIQFRLNQASRSPKRLPVFTGPALWAIYRATKGYPRKIVNLCHNSILAMIIQNKNRANWFLVRSCIQRVLGSRPRRSWQYAVLILLVLAGISLYIPKWLPQYEKMPIAEETRPQLQRQSAIRQSMPADSAKPAPSDISATELSTPDPLNQNNTWVASIGPTPLQQPETKDTSHAIKPSVTAEKSNIENPADTQPSVLGQLRVKRKETLGGLIQKTYGVFNSVYLHSLLRINPHITDPDTIAVDEVILFPAVPAHIKERSIKLWWVEIVIEDDIETAFKYIRNYPNDAPLSHMVPHWNQSSGLKFSLLLKKYYYDETSAANKMKALPKGLKANARVISGWDDHTVFYASPYPVLNK
jgi:general secretion pathway protein A